ncbi:MAG: hypothetical protein WDN28_22220 [Chthoniobacter sp.]
MVAWSPVPKAMPAGIKSTARPPATFFSAARARSLPTTTNRSRTRIGAVTASLTARCCFCRATVPPKAFFSRAACALVN